MKIKNTQKNSSGFTLVELLVYTTGLVLIGMILSLLIVQFYGLYKEIIILPRADRTGILLVDRITKEIRSASSVDAIESQFNTTQGVLDLNFVSNEVLTEKKFFVESGIVKYQENDGETVELTSKDFNVSNFNFYFINTPVSNAVRLTLEIQFQTRNATETKSYTGFAILRESYD